VAYRSSSTNTGTGATPNTAVPAGVAIDDIVLLASTMDVNGAPSYSGKFPTGFTMLNETKLTLDGQTAAIGWKRLTAADSGSYTFADTSAGPTVPWVCQAFAFSGRHTTNNPANSTASSNAANASPVSVNASTVTAVAGDDLLWVSGPDISAAVSATHAPPASYTERQDTTLTFSVLSGATQDNVSAGATGTVTGTLTLASGTAGWVAWLVRVPAAAGAAASLPFRRPAHSGLVMR
jgi:hypothetical protein